MANVAHIDQVLQQAADAKAVPGVVAAAATDQGVLYEGAFGKRDLGQPAAMTGDTVFWIASMTKALTGTAAMQLVEQGRLALDAPASKWAPQLADVKVLEGIDAAGEAKLRAPRSQITLRQLLTHTAGFGYDIWSADLGQIGRAHV